MEVQNHLQYLQDFRERSQDVGGIRRDKFFQRGSHNLAIFTERYGDDSAVMYFDKDKDFTAYMANEDIYRTVIISQMVDLAYGRDSGELQLIGFSLLGGYILAMEKLDLEIDAEIDEKITKLLTGNVDIRGILDMRGDEIKFYLVEVRRDTVERIIDMPIQVLNPIGIINGEFQFLFNGQLDIGKTSYEVKMMEDELTVELTIHGKVYSLNFNRYFPTELLKKSGSYGVREMELILGRVYPEFRELLVET